MIKEQIELILSNSENLVGVEDGRPIYTRETADKITEVFTNTQFVLNEEPWQNTMGASCFVCWIDEEGNLDYESFDILY